MKKKLVAATAFACLAIPVAAKTSMPDADPAMWLVKDEDTTIYMFGTFHLLDGKRQWFNDEVKTAFEASDELVLEAIIPDDPAEMQPLVVKYAVDPEGRKLSSQLEPQVKAELEKELGALGVPLEAFEPLEPWFVSMSLAALGAQKLGLTGEHGPETVLTKAARAKRMPVRELEGLEFQLSLFDKMGKDQQIASLSLSLNQIARIEEVFKPMVAAWSSGDTASLVALMNQGLEETPALHKLIFTDRNASWAEWIEQRLNTPGTVFLAVGAGHLAGKGSVQSFLDQHGIKAERVSG